MKKHWKKAVSIGCAACMLVSTMPVTGMNLIVEAQGVGTKIDGVVISGIWGTCAWELKDGVLTINGGVAESLVDNGAPWNDIKGDIYKVNITGNIAFDKNGINLRGLFSGCERMTEIQGLEKMDTSQVTDMSGMFFGCRSLTKLDVSGLNTSQVTNMSYMFSGCNELIELDVRGLDTRQVTDMSGMFFECRSLTKLDVSGFDTSQVTDMGYMFEGCKGLKEVDVSGFDTSQVADMSYMFWGNGSLTELDVSGFDTSQVTGMSYMFVGCELLKQIDMGNWDISKLESWYGMFSRLRINCIMLPSVLSSKIEWLDELSSCLNSGYWKDVTDDIIYTNETDIVWKAGHKYILKSVSSKQDSVTGITIKKQDDSMMDADIELKVSDVTANEDYTDYIQVVDKLGKTNCLFDIALEKDGTAIQPDGTVLVSIPLPDGMSETAKVYRIAEDGTATDMNEAFADGYLTFATDHFSVYAVVDENAVLGDVNGDGKFNMADAALVRRYVANMDVSVDTSAADVNKDGKIDMVDYALMRRALANWDVELK